MTTYTAEFLDTETDEVVELHTFQANTLEAARRHAEEEAEYQGFFLGTVAKTVR